MCTFEWQHFLPLCPDGSGELCNDECAPDSFTGRFTMKVRLPLPHFQKPFLGSMESQPNFAWFAHRDVWRTTPSVSQYFGTVMAKLTAPEALMSWSAPVKPTTCWNM